MARVLITCAGSIGDLLPYACIGRALRERGHTITFAVEQRFADWLKAEGFVVQVLAGDIITTFLAYAPHLPLTTNPLASIKILLNEYLLPTLPNRVEALVELCHDADILNSSTVQIVGMFAADLTRIRFASIALTPATIPHASFAPYPYPWPANQRLQRFTNQLSWLMGRHALRHFSSPAGAAAMGCRHGTITCLRAGYPNNLPRWRCRQ